MRLADLERCFWEAVRTRGAPPAGLDAWLTPSPRQSATERLGVYHLAYWQRQVVALTAMFPRTMAALGSDRDALAYIEHRPSCEPCIERLGEGFVQFLAERQRSTDDVLGLARLEWAETATLLAPNAKGVVPLTPELGENLPACRVALTPTLRVEHVPSAAFRRYAPATEVADGWVDVAFYRPEHAVRWVLLSRDETKALELARGGGTIALVCAVFADAALPLATQRALEVLTSWFARGWVTSCNP